jgi:hypothetical protein
MGIQIGEIDVWFDNWMNFNHKFVIAQERNNNPRSRYGDFVYYAYGLLGTLVPHTKIVAIFKERHPLIDTIFGGGHVLAKKDKGEVYLLVRGHSGSYGSPDIRLLEGFQDLLMNEYKKILPELQRIELRSIKYRKEEVEPELVAYWENHCED